MSLQSFYDDFAEEFVSSESRQSNSMSDWLLIMVTTLLFAMGLISIYSATYEAGMSEYFTKQLLFGVVGAIENMKEIAKSEKKRSGIDLDFDDCFIVCTSGYT